MHRAQAQLVCLMNDRLYLENKGDSVTQALCLIFDEIQHIEFGTVLLDSYLQIRGTRQKSQDILINLHSNTVSDSLYKKIINTIRQYWFRDTKTKDDYSFELLEAANLKVANFTRHCILAGEKVMHLIWQPELRRSRI